MKTLCMLAACLALAAAPAKEARLVDLKPAGVEFGMVKDPNDISKIEGKLYVSDDMTGPTPSLADRAARIFTQAGRRFTARV